MTNKHEVIALHKLHPDWCSQRIADLLGCESAYVRATAQRNGLVLGVSERADLLAKNPLEYARRLRLKARVLIARAAKIEAEARRK